MSDAGAVSRSLAGSMKRMLTLVGGRPAGQTREADDTLGHNDIHRLAQRELMDRIASFLTDNRLDVTPANLFRAHAAFSGADLPLAVAIAEKEATPERVTQSWLELVSCSQSEDPEREQLDRLASELGDSLESFSHTARNARSAAADYRDALTTQVEEIASNQLTSKLLGGLAGLTQALLERTKQAEDEMRQSEREARKLRKNLAEAQHAADFDHLTGLHSRRAFEALLERHCEEAREQSDRLCVAFCDIDNFKPVNDTHGHETGDRVLRLIARSLAGMADDKCFVARHGGDEFVMLFRGASVSDAYECLDSVRDELAARSFVNRSSKEPIGRITISAGIADVFAYADGRSALCAADAALYRAKGGGRNRIELAA